MAERLTEKHNNGSYTGKGNDLWDILYKLGEFEDIMEKYGIESVDTLEHIIKKGKVIIALADEEPHECLCWKKEQKKELDKIYAILEKHNFLTVDELDKWLSDTQNPDIIFNIYNKIETDRDTWKRACELALKEDYPNRNIPKEDWDEHLKLELNYFYRQAKNEKESK